MSYKSAVNLRSIYNLHPKSHREIAVVLRNVFAAWSYAVRERSMKRYGLILAVIGVFALVSCESESARVAEKEDALSAAGFIVKPANTPERVAMLNRLPPHQFVQRVNGDTVHYVYADPLVCRCLYVGTQQAYGQYKQQQLQQHLADEQLMTAQAYSDAAWNWNAWGPWPPGAPYGFVYGPVGW